MGRAFGTTFCGSYCGTSRPVTQANGFLELGAIGHQSFEVKITMVEEGKEGETTIRKERRRGGWNESNKREEKRKRTVTIQEKKSRKKRRRTNEECDLIGT